MSTITRVREGGHQSDLVPRIVVTQSHLMEPMECGVEDKWVRFGGVVLHVVLQRGYEGLVGVGLRCVGGEMAWSVESPMTCWHNGPMPRSRNCEGSQVWPFQNSLANSPHPWGGVGHVVVHVQR